MLSAKLSELRDDIGESLNSVEELLGDLNGLLRTQGEKLDQQLAEKVKGVISSVEAIIKMLFTSFQDIYQSLSGIAETMISIQEVIDAGVSASATGINMAVETVDDVMNVIRRTVPV